MKNPFFKTFRLFVLPVIGLFILSSCHTMQGVGKDIQKGGEKIEDKATDVKNK